MTSTSVEERVYHVTKGACGNVVFVESIGTDSLSAFEAVEARKVEQFGRENIHLEAYVLDVVDENGNVPDAAFYALRVLDAETGTHLHSVSEVITSDGDLFKLQWCLD